MGIIDGVVHVLDVVPAPLAIMILAALPVGEVRVSIPVAILHYKMGWGEAITWSLIGNLGVIPLIWWLLPHVEALLRRSARLDRGIDWLYDRTRRKVSRKVERYREAAILGFIAIPLPGTGAWAGVLVAYLFGFQWRRAWPEFYAGVVLACFITAIVVETGSFAFGIG